MTKVRVSTLSRGGACDAAIEFSTDTCGQSKAGG